MAWWALDWVVALAVAGGYVPEPDDGLARRPGARFQPVLVSGATGLVFGLAPAWQASRVDLTLGLKDSITRSAAGRAAAVPDGR